MNKYTEARKADFNKSVEFFKKEAANLRTGRANPNMLEGILVEAYGAKSPINSLANVSVPDGQSMVIAPWDRSIIKDVEKALVNENLGLGVVNEGDKIRLTVPKMTEENRRDLVRKLNECLEDARISVRKARDEAKGDIEKAEEDKEISEDDKFRFLKELDEEVARRNDELKGLRDRKEKDIMTI